MDECVLRIAHPPRPSFGRARGQSTFFSTARHWYRPVIANFLQEGGQPGGRGRVRALFYNTRTHHRTPLTRSHHTRVCKLNLDIPQCCRELNAMDASYVERNDGRAKKKTTKTTIAAALFVRLLALPISAKAAGNALKDAITARRGRATRATPREMDCVFAVLGWCVFYLFPSFAPFVICTVEGWTGIMSASTHRASEMRT